MSANDRVSIQPPPGFMVWTVIFGNPAAGAKLLARNLSAAVDIPLQQVRERAA